MSAWHPSGFEPDYLQGVLPQALGGGPPSGTDDPVASNRAEQILSILAHQSWDRARSRRRPDSWPRRLPTLAADFQRARDLAHQLALSLPNEQRGTVLEVVNQLIGHVHREWSAEDWPDETLAGELLEMRPHAEIDGAPSVMRICIAVLRMAGTTGLGQVPAMPGSPGFDEQLDGGHHVEDRVTYRE